MPKVDPPVLRDNCPGCRGTGQLNNGFRYTEDGVEADECEYCFGRGKVTQARRRTLLMFFAHKARLDAQANRARTRKKASSGERP